MKLESIIFLIAIEPFLTQIVLPKYGTNMDFIGTLDNMTFLVSTITVLIWIYVEHTLRFSFLFLGATYIYQIFLKCFSL